MGEPHQPTDAPGDALASHTPRVSPPEAPRRQPTEAAPDAPVNGPADERFPIAAAAALASTTASAHPALSAQEMRAALDDDGLGNGAFDDEHPWALPADEPTSWMAASLRFAPLTAARIALVSRLYTLRAGITSPQSRRRVLIVGAAVVGLALVAGVLGTMHTSPTTLTASASVPTSGSTSTSEGSDPQTPDPLGSAQTILDTPQTFAGDAAASMPTVVPAVATVPQTVASGNATVPARTTLASSGSRMPVPQPPVGPPVAPLPPPGPTTAPPPVPVPGVTHFDFENGTTQQWTTAWGATISCSAVRAHAHSGNWSLNLQLTGTGYAAVSNTNAAMYTGLRPGMTVTYWIHAPAGVSVSVRPFATDNNWAENLVPNIAIVPGWNQVTWTVPTQSGVRGIGLQVDDISNWKGSLNLDGIAW